MEDELADIRNEFCNKVRVVHSNECKIGKTTAPASTFYILGKCSMSKENRPYGVNVFRSEESVYRWILHIRSKGININIESFF